MSRIKAVIEIIMFVGGIIMMIGLPITYYQLPDELARIGLAFGVIVGMLFRSLCDIKFGLMFNTWKKELFE